MKIPRGFHIFDEEYEEFCSLIYGKEVTDSAVKKEGNQFYDCLSGESAKNTIKGEKGK